MKFNQLTNLRTKKNPKRKGRGLSAGSGKTAGRGTKGQKSRSGGGTRPFFEGGQTPLVRKLPKLAGFKSFKPPTQAIYTGSLDDIKTTSKIIDNYVLVQTGLIEHSYQKVKLIRHGEIKKAHHLHIQAISKAALEELQKAGGKFEKTSRPQRPTSIKKQERRTAKENQSAKNKQGKTAKKD